MKAFVDRQNGPAEPAWDAYDMRRLGLTLLFFRGRYASVIPDA